MMLSACRKAKSCQHICCICTEDPTLQGEPWDTYAELNRLSTIRTQGNPFPMGSEAFDAFELCRKPAFQ